MTNSRLLAFAFAAPAMAVLVLILGWPLVSAFLLSLQDVRSVGAAGQWVGFANYQKVLADPVMWRSMGMSLAWVLANGVLQTGLALMAALVLNEQFPGVKIARTWIILTWIVPTVVVVIIWRWLFSTSGGMINPLMINMGLIERPVGFFNSPWSAFATLVFINSWRWFPFITLMLLAGMTRIPADLYEAARIDGANAWKRFSRITWPLLKPTMAVLGVVGTLLSFNVFDIIWLLTAGGPAGGTRTLPILIYETAFKGYRLSEAATLSVIATLVLVAFALVTARSMDNEGGRT
ncbi:carbohydrate ABC transporter permease [Rhizobium alvei]|uniref:Sugar ABC transporter permease n=1 Tax=Rhizobium alvei TaxID=1132659 RepID=A0ABT8YIA6_9HYPH|nr:sugar ABC transporter permease [Rhizobium alvei]MDO6963378.1 sugar ABC transporter permease [Rhizobium alvei]